MSVTMRKSINKSTNEIYAKNYAKCGFIPFNLSIDTKDNGKKILKNIPTFSDIKNNNYSNYINDNLNGMGLRMGCMIDNHYIILIDIDNKEDGVNDVKNGLTKWKELIKGKDAIITPMQKTGNNGLHYLFKVDADTFENLPASITELVISGVKYSIDFKGKNQFMLVEPSKYDGKVYKWLTKYDTEIQDLPSWLLWLIIKHEKEKVLIKVSKVFKASKTIKDKIDDTDTDIDDNVVGINNNEINDEEDDEDIDNEVEIFKTHIAPTFKKDFLQNILSGLKGFDDLDEWTHIGMALKNESMQHKDEYFSLWDDWSRQSTVKYDGEDICKKKWNSFKKTRGGYSIKYLLTLLKIYDKELHAKMKQYIKIQGVLKDNKQNFPDNECLVNKINSTDKSHSVIIADAYCPIHNKKHTGADSHRVFEITNYGTACMKCTNEKCYGKICPKDGIMVSKNTIKQIFLINNITNNNYNYGGKYSRDVKSVLGKTQNIFSDPMLNKLMINSLNAGDALIADVVSYVYFNKICFVDDIWYLFNGIIWVKYRNAYKKIMAEFVKLYENIKDYIRSSEEMLEVEKGGYLDQINKIESNVSKNKNIVVLLEEKMGKRNTFDINNNLFVFNNGIYDFDKMKFRKMCKNEKDIDIMSKNRNGNCNMTDMLKKSCGYDYSVKYIDKQKLLDMLLDIFPSNESMEYFLLHLAFAICGKIESNLLLIMQWVQGRDRYKIKLVDLIKETLGEYCCNISKLSLIVSDKSKNYNEFLYLENIRFVIVDSVKHVSHDDSLQLIDIKSIKSKNKNNTIRDVNINFSLLCMCEELPTYDEDVVENIGYISTLNDEYMDYNVDKCDFFLLLVEYLKKVKNGTVLINEDTVKLVIKTNIEKICYNFMKNCVRKSNTREKCADVYDRYLEWSKDNNYDEQLSKIKLFSVIKKHFTYIKSVKYGNVYTSAFANMILI
jgi:hypothetical protein